MEIKQLFKKLLKKGICEIMEIIINKGFTFDMYLNPFNIKEDQEILINRNSSDNIQSLDAIDFYYESDKDRILINISNDNNKYKFEKCQSYRLIIESDMQNPGISSSFSSGYGLFIVTEVEDKETSKAYMNFLNPSDAYLNLSNPDEDIVKSLFTDLLRLVHNLYDYKEGTITIKLERF